VAKNITPREKDYPRWYLDVINAGGLADYAPVRGCMVIKPHGYAVWEAIQQALDGMFKATGHVNAYFPLFIPQSFLAKEAQHVEGFAMECAVVTHSGLEKTEEGVLVPKGKLEEPLVVRPTSETVIGAMYAKWVQSWRDLPILINQWANVVRWEMRTRLFLRTMEFLWQEGHTAHETEEEAHQETLRILEIYRTFAEEWLAVPVVTGQKSESEKFAGAERTYTIEGMMQDKKALQMGTSHDLGRNFAKAFEIRFQGRDKTLQYAWTTSWGVSTRLIGALIMAHSDDEGLILPPKVAPIQLAVVPIWKGPEEKAKVLEAAEKAAASARAALGDRKVVLDDRDELKPGPKFFEWEQKGVPFRLEIGPRDVNDGAGVLVSRLDRTKEKVPFDRIGEVLPGKLEAYQKALLERARSFRDSHTFEVDDYRELKERVQAEGGFYLVHWDGTPESETRFKEDMKASIRCIPGTVRDGEFQRTHTEPGTCIVSGKPSPGRVIVAQAY